MGWVWVGEVPRPPMIRTAGLSEADDADGVGWCSAVSLMVAVRAWDSAGV